MVRRLSFLLGLTLLWMSPAHAAVWQDEWNALAAKAKGQSFAAIVAGEQAYSETVEEFGRKFGVKVELANMRPSQALSRLQTEQRNGQFGWDMWFGGTSNMTNTASPAGLLEDMPKYLFIPEVTDPSNWDNPDLLYGDSQRRVVTFVHRLEFYSMRNNAVLPEVKIQTWDDLFDPRLKGKISIRDSSVPNGGSFMLATFLGAKGPDALRRFLKDQDVHVYENPEQLQQAIFRGGQAVAFGLETFLLDRCKAEGGCKDVQTMRQFANAISIGFCVPKNPPHPEVAKLWSNWFLSKEGQEFFVKAWVKENSTGGVTMRKDLPPLPGHQIYLPDFDHPEKYTFVSIQKGTPEIDAAIKIFKEVTNH